MATRAHSTRTPLLRPSAEAPALLGLGLGRQPGPVTVALAAMQAADPDRVRYLRRRISDRIEADLALLDALDGDPDREDGGDAEPSLGSQERSASGGYVISYFAVDPTTGQERWGASGTDDREEEDEHGGDIQDEPHDEEPDREPSLCGLTVDWPSAGGYDGEAGDDNGIADQVGATEQALRFLDTGGDLNTAGRFAGRAL